MVIKNHKIIAVIQARMGSTRLPGKVLMNIESLPVLGHIVNRLRQVKTIDKVVVATSIKEKNKEIVKFCQNNDFDFFVGSEDNVLDRFYKACIRHNPNHVIRVTGDCPLIDPELVQKLINYYLNKNFDYCGVATGAGVSDQTHIKKYPDGMDCEIFKFSVLKKTHRVAKKKLYTEHVTPYIWSNPKIFKLGKLCSDNHYGDYRLTLDNEEDFKLISWIYSELYTRNKFFSLNDVISLLEKNKKQLKNNQHLIGKEGYEVFSKKN